MVEICRVALGVVQPTMKKAVSEISARDRRGRSLGFMLNSIDRQFMTNQQSRVKVDHLPGKADVRNPNSKKQTANLGTRMWNIGFVRADGGGSQCKEIGRASC